MEATTYLNPTQEAGRDFIMRGIEGPVVMLNLLRFREVADYSANPELAPQTQISGAQAYNLYMAHTLPFLHKSGGEILFLGQGGPLLIGPTSECWDCAMLVRSKQRAVVPGLCGRSGLSVGPRGTVPRRSRIRASCL